MFYYIDAVLSDEQRAALVDRDVSFSEMTLGTEAFHRHGIAFSTEDCDTVLGILGLIRAENEGDDCLETPQGQIVDDYYVPYLADLPTPAKPIVWMNEAFIGGFDREVFQESQPGLGLGLAITYRRREFVDYRHVPGVLFVNVFCSPSESWEMAEDTFGNLSHSYNMVPQGLGEDYVPINYTDGKTLAYFRGDANGGSLWVLFRTDNAERGLLDYIMHSATRLVHPESGAACSYDEYDKVASRERFIGLAGQRLKEEGNEVNRNISNSPDRIERARTELARALRETEAAKHRAEELEHGNQGEMLRQMQERLAKEFDEILASPDFESLEFQDNQVIAVTRPIKLRHEGRVYEMGRYRIRIPCERRISVESMDGVISTKGDCHPHVRDSFPCLGNASESVAKLQAEMSFGLLLPYLVNYLEHGYNPADSYSRPDEFQVKNYPESKEVKKPRKPRRKPAKRKAKAGAKGKAKAKPKAKAKAGAKAGSGKPRRKGAKRSKTNEVKDVRSKPGRKRAARSGKRSG